MSGVLTITAARRPAVPRCSPCTTLAASFRDRAVDGCERTIGDPQVAGAGWGRAQVA